MAKNLSLGPLVISDNSVYAINVILAEIQERLDALAGLRGNVILQAPATVPGVVTATGLHQLGASIDA